MLGLLDFKSIGEFFLEEIEGINSFIYGADDTDIQQKIDRLDPEEYPVLVGIIPSSDSSSRNMDTRESISVCFFYVLQPIKERTNEEEEAVWLETEGCVSEVEALVFNNYETKPLFRKIQANSFHYDPEYGIWSLMGWSVHFVLEN